MQEIGCPLAKDALGRPVENLALDEKLSEQVELLKVVLSIHSNTMDSEVLKEPFKQMGLYEDVFSYADILITWNQYTARNKSS